MNAPVESVVVRAVDPRVAATEGLFVEADFRYGRIRYLATDFGVGAMIAKYGEYFEGEVALMRRFLEPGDVVVSAGGNIGVHLIPLSQIVGLVGRVITFEPQPFIREHLLYPNLAMNGCTNVDVRHDALGEVIGTARFPRVDYTLPNNFGGLGIDPRGEDEVSVVPLDFLKLEHCEMLMLDVEGFELQALRGAVQTIERCRPLLYIEIDREQQREPVLQYMRSLKYELLYHTPAAFNPDNFAKNTDNPFGNMCSMMCLGVPA